MRRSSANLRPLEEAEVGLVFHMTSKSSSAVVDQVRAGYADVRGLILGYSPNS